MRFDVVSESRCGGGAQRVMSHRSEVTGCDMRFGLFVPEGAPTGLLVYLSGLTCTEQNVLTKGHYQAAANEVGALVLCPDTSPRGDDVPDDDDWDFGKGAGFYLDATREPWARHYRMRSYLLDELLPAVCGEWYVPRVGITGHSMGGHGALVLALSHPERFASLSAFAPIASATRCPWGRKALGGYLGDPDRADQDASRLLAARGWKGPILVDQGAADSFLAEQLQPEHLADAARAAGVALELRMQDGYDHSYYFVSTFLPEHVRWHAAQWSGLSQTASQR